MEKMWIIQGDWTRRESNTQPSDLESDALPLRHGSTCYYPYNTNFLIQNTIKRDTNREEPHCFKFKSQQHCSLQKKTMNTNNSSSKPKKLSIPISDAISRIQFAPNSNNLLISSWDSVSFVWFFWLIWVFFFLISLNWIDFVFWFFRIFVYTIWTLLWLD